ncbi:DUF1990 domain-containing protein [Rhodococcus sp. Q]|uniref:DUF1990 family protein n=1 Tax=Rhodococcus sp. Q TaxID=2502252 RepID=UPI0010F7D463|nr:DUF1990 domain-containing protein [Rhodococcus sp. Q]
MRTRERRLTYREVGATAHELPDGYHHLQRSRVLGTGGALFERAADELRSWTLHERAGVRVSGGRVAVGDRVRLRIRVGPLPVVAHCEIVYVVDEPRRRGFAYGTLTGHPERGEELFCVEWRADDSVVLTITAFSRPALWWSRLGAVPARAVQCRITDRYLAAL